jgi:subtilisin
VSSLHPRLAVLSLLLLIVLLAGGCGGSGVGSMPGGSAATDLSLSATQAGTATATATATIPAANGSSERVIIGFRSAPGADDEGLVRGHSGRVRESLSLVNAMAADLPAADIETLRRHARVAYIEPDAVARATVDTIPWGITRVQAPLVWPTNTGAGVKLAIIDTGIDYNHADLAGRYKGGYNFVAKNNSPLDDNGHGTHVAGIAAASANGAGVEGVGPGVSLYALKALDQTGSGYYSDIIAALQWCVTNHMRIASMSLGGSTGSTALQQACAAAYNAGVLVVAAAGNSGTTSGAGNTVEYPAAYSSVVAVAATDSNNVRAYFSSTGAKVELAAPGVSIVSDRLGGGTITYSGTSMACPAVSGAAALVFASGVTTAAGVRSRLDSTAKDLGAAGRDPLYGYGLLNAYKAVHPTLVAAK